MQVLISVSLKSDTLEHPNMVWEVKTNQMPNAVQKLLLVVDKRTSGMNESLELLKCNENLPSSPGYASCDEHMELGKQHGLQRRPVLRLVWLQFSCGEITGS